MAEATSEGTGRLPNENEGRLSEMPVKIEGRLTEMSAETAERLAETEESLVEMYNENIEKRTNETPAGTIVKRTAETTAESGPKRLCLDIKTKIQIIIDKSQSPKTGQRQLARKYGCSKSQIQRILSNRNEIIKDWESDCSSTKKRGRSETYGGINAYLWEWYQKCLQSNIPMNGRMLLDEALDYAKLTGVTGFDGSRGWLEKWKKRHGVVFSETYTRGSIEDQNMNSWKERSCELMTDFQAEDIWNMELTGIYWRALPTKTSEGCIERTHAEQLTWAFFFNAAGEKMEPIVIGKNKVPRSFRKLRIPERPFGCRYFSNAKSLMQTDVMKFTLMRLDRRLALERRHILLYLDTAPYHPKTLRDCVHNIHIEFLPKNSEENTREPESGLIRSWKIKTRIRLLRYICSKIDSGKTVESIVKSVSLLDAIQWGKLAWDEIDQYTITKCFKKAGLFPDEADELDDLFDGVEFMDLKYLCERMDSEFDAAQYIEDDVPTFELPVDASDPKWREMLQQQLIKNIIVNHTDVNEGDNHNTTIDDYDVAKNDPIVKSASEACDSLEEIKSYAHNIDDEDLANMLENVLDRLRIISIFQSSQKLHAANDVGDRAHSVAASEQDIGHHTHDIETSEQNVGYSTAVRNEHDMDDPTHNVVLLNEHNIGYSEHTANRNKQDMDDPAHNVVLLNEHNIGDRTHTTVEQEKDNNPSVLLDEHNIGYSIHTVVKNEHDMDHNPAYNVQLSEDDIGNPTHNVASERNIGDHTHAVERSVQNMYDEHTEVASKHDIGDLAHIEGVGYYVHTEEMDEQEGGHV